MTEKTFVIGQPVAHSRSPLIHGHWLKTHGINGSYERIEVAPADLPAFFARLRGGAFIGGNVTVPHKQAALALIDEADDAARAIGAVNTIVRRDNRLLGSNSDWYGFLANLDERAPGWDAAPGAALIIGAGGSARGIVYALSQRGFSPIHVLNRTEARAEALVAAMTDKVSVRLEAHPLDAFGALAPDIQIVVNTTTIGMNGSRFDDLPLARLPKTARVADIVYTPLETPLLADAAARGLESIDGLGMLLHQAVPGFAQWWGVRPKVTAGLRRLVEKDMGLT